MTIKLSYLPLDETLLFKAFEIYVNEVFFIGEQMLCSDKNFTGDCHLYFIFCFFLTVTCT